MIHLLLASPVWIIISCIDFENFSFLNSEYNNDQWIIYYKTIQAEDERGIKGGPREDYVSDISLKLSYSFKLFRKNASLGLSFFNILDFGSEISEYVFSGGERYSLELQIPKSIRFNLSFELWFEYSSMLKSSYREEFEFNNI